MAGFFERVLGSAGMVRVLPGRSGQGERIGVLLVGGVGKQVVLLLSLLLSGGL